MNFNHMNLAELRTYCGFMRKINKQSYSLLKEYEKLLTELDNHFKESQNELSFSSILSSVRSVLSQYEINGLVDKME